MSAKKKKPNNDVTKKLQTELQALMAYGCYDSPSVLQAGDSAKKSGVSREILRLYMPSGQDGDHLSHVDKLLEGKDKYRYLFEVVESVSNPNNPQLVIPEVMHCMAGKEILVGKGCIDRSLLTRKNLSNFADVSEKTLFRHAKEVEANCKKALACCLAEGSPYRNFKGSFDSGTNRDDYLNWLRKAMKTSACDVIVDEDEKNGTSSADDIADPDVLCDNYFRGYFAFALWGYIPPDGGDNFKSSLIGTIVSTGKKKKEDSRNATREVKVEEKKYLKDLDVRGENASDKDRNAQLNDIGEIMKRGRKEMAKQRLYKCRIDKVEFEMRYQTSRIKEIKDELIELRDDSDEDEDNAVAIIELKREMKEVRKDKKDSYKNWKIVTDAEEGRRTLLDMDDDDVDDSVDLATHFDHAESIDSRSTMTESVQSKAKCSHLTPSSK